MFKFYKKETIVLIKEAYSDISPDVTIQWCSRIQRIKASQWKQKICSFIQLSTLTPLPLSSKTITISQFEPSQTRCTYRKCRGKEFLPRSTEWKKCVLRRCHTLGSVRRTIVYKTVHISSYISCTEVIVCLFGASWTRDAQPIWPRHVLCPYMTWPSRKIYRDHMWPWPTHYYKHTTWLWLCSYQKQDKLRRK